MNNKSNNFQKWLLVSLVCLASIVTVQYLGLLETAKTTSTQHDTHRSLNIATLIQSNSIKGELWQAMEKEVANWGDRLGMPIDLGIKNTVIALNLLGFKTNESCEGHIDWGLAYPWVGFELIDEEIVTLSSQPKKIYERIEKTEKDLPEQNELYKAYHSINDQIEIHAKAKLLPLRELLINFYTNRSIDPDRMITVHELNPTFLRIYSLGGAWQVIRNKEGMLQKLKEYQEEMNLFADFLTHYFFEK